MSMPASIPTSNRDQNCGSEDVFEFFHSKLQSNSFAVFDEMKRKEEQIDVTIKTGEKAIPAHRLVLSAAIPYFRTMFGSGMSESKMKEIPMKETDPVALECLIDFAYTSRVKITPENVQPLLLTSEFLQIAEVKDGCCQFLSKRLNPSNVMNIQTLAGSLNCQSLVDSTNTYIREHFEEFCQDNEFLSLPFPVFKELIRKDDLRVANEEKVFEAVLKWVKADPERNSALPELLTGVRMTLLSPNYLVKNVSNEKLIRLSIPCRDLVDEAKHSLLLPKDASVCRSFATRERSCNVKKPEPPITTGHGNRFQYGSVCSSASNNCGRLQYANPDYYTSHHFGDFVN